MSLVERKTLTLTDFGSQLEKEMSVPGNGKLKVLWALLVVGIGILEDIGTYGLLVKLHGTNKPR